MPRWVACKNQKIYSGQLITKHKARENWTFAHMVSGFPLMKSKQTFCLFKWSFRFSLQTNICQRNAIFSTWRFEFFKLFVVSFMNCPRNYLCTKSCKSLRNRKQMTLEGRISLIWNKNNIKNTFSLKVRTSIRKFGISMRTKSFVTKKQKFLEMSKF